MFYTSFTTTFMKKPICDLDFMTQNSKVLEGARVLEDLEEFWEKWWFDPCKVRFLYII